MSFAENLKRLRSERHLSQRDLAKRLGLSNATIACYETGARKPSFEALVKLNDFFDYDLLSEETESESMPVAGNTDTFFNDLAYWAGYTIERDEDYTALIVKDGKRYPLDHDKVFSIMKTIRSMTMVLIEEGLDGIEAC